MKPQSSLRLLNDAEASLIGDPATASADASTSGKRRSASSSPPERLTDMPSL